MPFERNAPEPLVTDRLVIRPQRPGDNQPDYDAVMANREWLRRWSGSSWPAADFSLENNLRDLAEHIIEHEKQIAYGFSIVTDDAVLGSVYVNEVSTLTESYEAPPDVAAVLAAAGARADIWARADQGPAVFDVIVGDAVDWLEKSELTPLVWCARANCPELERAYTAAGLARIGEVKNATGRVQLIYAKR